MLFNDVDKSKPYTVLMITEPVRLACFSFAGFPRGVYYIQGDFRCKIAKPHDRRLVQAGLVTLRYVSETEKPEDFRISEALAAQSMPPAIDPGFVPTEVAAAPTEPDAVPSALSPVPTETVPIATETAPVVTEPTLPLAPTSDDHEPVVILGAETDAAGVELAVKLTAVTTATGVTVGAESSAVASV